MAAWIDRAVGLAESPPVAEPLDWLRSASCHCLQPLWKNCASRQHRRTLSSFVCASRSPKVTRPPTSRISTANTSLRLIKITDSSLSTDLNVSMAKFWLEYQPLRLKPTDRAGVTGRVKPNGRAHEISAHSPRAMPSGPQRLLISH